MSDAMVCASTEAQSSNGASAHAVAHSAHAVTVDTSAATTKQPQQPDVTPHTVTSHARKARSAASTVACVRRRAHGDGSSNNNGSNRHQSWLAAATHASDDADKHNGDVAGDTTRVRCVIQRTVLRDDDDNNNNVDKAGATMASVQQPQQQQRQPLSSTAVASRGDDSRASSSLRLLHGHTTALTASRAAAIAATTTQVHRAQRRSLSCLVAAAHTSSNSSGSGGNSIGSKDAEATASAHAQPRRRQWLTSKSVALDKPPGSVALLRVRTRNGAAASSAVAATRLSRPQTTPPQAAATAATAAVTVAASRAHDECASAPPATATKTPATATTTPAATTTPPPAASSVYVAPRHHLRARVSNASSRPARVVVNVYLSKYALVRRVAQALGYTVQDTEDALDAYAFNLCWSDTVLPLTRLVRLGNWQRTNHFPAMYMLCRKSHLGRTLGVLRRHLPQHFAFYPRTWMLRCERVHFEAYWTALQQRRQRRDTQVATTTATTTTTTTTTTTETTANANTNASTTRHRRRGSSAAAPFFILKPNAGCQGRGIVVTRDPLHAVDDLDNYIVQEYIARPMLIEGCKFDLRVYVLLTSIREPSIFLFDDGLVRLCANAYAQPSDDNVKDSCMHLTNYAINKRSGHYVYNDDAEHFDVGNKRNFRFFNQWLREVQKRDVATFWSQVAAIVVKTILAAQPQICHVYNTCFPAANEGYTCFELLGFDILVDSKARPWLMEVNHTPSLATDTPLDLDIKRKLLTEVWQIVGCAADDQQRDCVRVRAQFTLRNMPPWVAAQDAAARAARSNNNSNKVGESSAAPGNNNNNSSGSTATAAMTHGVLSTYEKALQEDAHGVPRYVQERRAREDSRLCHFARIYPSNDAAQQRIYDEVRACAKAHCAWQDKLPTLRTNSGDMGHYFSYYYYHNNNNNNNSGGGGVAAGSSGSNVSSPLRGSATRHGTTTTTTASNAVASSTAVTAPTNNNDNNNNNHHGTTPTTLLMYTHQLLEHRLRRDRYRPRVPTYRHSIASAAESVASTTTTTTMTSPSSSLSPRDDVVPPSPTRPLAASAASAATDAAAAALRASTHDAALSYQTVSAEMQRLRRRAQQSVEQQQQQRRGSNVSCSRTNDDDDDELQQQHSAAAADMAVATTASSRDKSPLPLQPPPPLPPPAAAAATAAHALTDAVTTSSSSSARQHPQHSTSEEQQHNNSSRTATTTLHKRAGSDAVAAVVAAAPRTRTLPSPDTATVTLTEDEVRWLTALQDTLDSAAAADPELSINDDDDDEAAVAAAGMAGDADNDEEEEE